MLFGFAILMSAATAMPPSYGVHNRSVEVDGTKYPYAVHVPEKRRRGMPVILFLHGSGERGADGLKPALVGLGPALRDHPERVPAIVVFPQVPLEERWLGEPAEAAMKALDAAIAEFRGDRSRVYLTGLSMGGYGAWHLALAHPDRFAAIVPICGGLLPHPSAISVRQSPLTMSAADPYSFTGRALRRMPVWIFHGADDTVIPVSESRRMAEALRKVGGDVRYTEYPGVGHGSWDRAYSEKELWRWLFAQKRRKR